MKKIMGLDKSLAPKLNDNEISEKHLSDLWHELYKLYSLIIETEYIQKIKLEINYDVHIYHEHFNILEKKLEKKLEEELVNNNDLILCHKNRKWELVLSIFYLRMDNLTEKIKIELKKYYGQNTLFIKYLNNKYPLPKEVYIEFYNTLVNIS